MTHRLRYTGDRETVFQTGNVGLVEPGGEFGVPDEMLLRFMRRPDVEHAGECPAPPCRCGEEPQPEPGLQAPEGGGASADSGSGAAEGETPSQIRTARAATKTGGGKN